MDTVRDRQQSVDWARRLLSTDFLILDFETTGLRDAHIVQVGVIDRQGNTLLDTLVNPGQRIPQDATRVHGISDEMVRDAPAFNSLYVQLSVMLAGKVVVAYNASYDEGVLKGVCKRHGLPVPRARRWECAMRAYARFYGAWNAARRSYTWQNLGKACVQQSIQVNNAHSAVGDCLMTLRLIEAMAR